MRYNEPEALEQIRRLGKQIRKRRARGYQLLLGGFSGVLTLLLVFLIGSAPHGTVSTSEAANMGSFLLRAENGVFVCVAVVAFVLGVTVALLCVRRSRWKESRRQSGEELTQAQAASPEEAQTEPGAVRIFTDSQGGTQK